MNTDDDNALFTDDVLHLIHEQTSPSDGTDPEEYTLENATMPTETPPPDDDFLPVHKRHTNDNPDEVVIIATSTCHWTIFEVPVLEPKKPEKVAQYVLDVLNAASEKDPSFLLIQADLLTDSLVGTTRQYMLLASQFHTRILRDDKARQFIRNPNARHSPNHLRELPDPVYWLYRFEANLATSININDLLNHLHSTFHPYGGRAILHTLNDAESAKAGVLLFSSSHINRTELSSAITTASGIPVHIRLSNLARLVKCYTDETRDAKRAGENIILVETSEEHLHSLQQFLKHAYPLTPRHPSMYLTHRQMQFLLWTDIEGAKQTQVMINYIASHHYYNMAITSKRIKTLRPLTTHLVVAPDRTITLKHALSLLYQPYKIGRPP